MLDWFARRCWPITDTCLAFPNGLTTRLLDVVHQRFAPSRSDVGILGQQHDDDEYDNYRHYWQRPEFISGTLAGRGARKRQLQHLLQLQQQASVRPWTEASDHFEQYHAPYEYIASGERLPAGSCSIPAQSNCQWQSNDGTAVAVDLHNAHRHPDGHDGGQYPQSVWPGCESVDAVVRAQPVSQQRRAVNNMMFSAQTGLVSTLGHGANVKNKWFNGLPATARTSLRSEGSGQSSICRPCSQSSQTNPSVRPLPEVDEGRHHTIRPQILLPYQQRNHHQIRSIYQPHSLQYKTTLPEFTNHRDFNPALKLDPLNQEPNRTGAPQLPSLRELPSLRPIHEPQPPIQSIQPFIRNHQNSSNSISIRSTFPVGSRVAKKPLLEPVPEAIYDSRGAPLSYRVQGNTLFLLN